MLKSELIIQLSKQYKTLSIDDIETIINLFFKKILTGLDEEHNIEIRGFGTLTKKTNKEKYVRNPKTDERIYKQNTYKIHFKTGKILHHKLNPINNTDE